LKSKRLFIKTVILQHQWIQHFSRIFVLVCFQILWIEIQAIMCNFRPQNGQIKIPNSQILDLESPDFLNSSSQIHKSYEGKRPQDDIDPRFQFILSRIILYPDGLCRLQVLQSHHDFPTVGHFGFNKPMELISRDFWWPQMWKTVKDYVTTCDICSHSKVPCHRSYGLLHLLPILNKS
jgi:hypothetical protein